MRERRLVSGEKIAVVPQKWRLRPPRRLPSGVIVYVGFVAIFLFFALTLRDKGFLTFDNQLNVLRQTAFVSVMAFGTTFALSAGEIDLSIGQVVALSAMITAVLLRDLNAVVAVPAGLAVGIVTGLANGLLTTRLRVPSFLITLGMGGIIGGLSRWVTQLQPVPVLDNGYTFIFGSGDIGPFPTLFLWTVGVLVVAHVAYRQTTFGRQLLATGGNRIAARYSGINTDRVRIASLVICSATASLAGLLYVGRLHSARYTLGETDLLTVIAAAVIGGTSMAGGRGSIVGALLGSLVMGVLNNGLILMGFSVTEQQIARGVIIIVAVAVSLREAPEG
ncbi:MAG TPA: ABC transporter permease [Candidatus Limnocylindrales bacterium]